MTELPIIDFRARPNTSEYMRAYRGLTSLWKFFGYPEPPAVELSAFVDELRKNNIETAVFTGRQRVVDGNIVSGVSNDYVAECVNSYPDRIIGFASVDPTTGSAAVREFRRAVRDLKLRGLSLDPFKVSLFPDDRRMYPLYQTAIDLEVPVTFTVGPRVGRFGDPRHVDVVATDFPELEIVLSHGCYPQVTELIALALSRENVYLEASIYEFLPGAEPFVDAAKDVLQDKVVYASAFPFNPVAIRSKFESLGFDDAVQRKLMYHNAARLLRL